MIARQAEGPPSTRERSARGPEPDAVQVRVLAADRDVIVAISRVWQTTCTAVRSGEEALVIDSPVYPDELEALPRLLEQAGFTVSALLTTHGDWDHLLGRLAFPRLSLGCAQTTAARLAAQPGSAQRRLRRFDEQHYVERPAPLSLPDVQALPVPGRVSVGSSGNELELYSADGHTADGMAVWIPWALVLVCGDYLSPVEIPMISPGGSASAYLATLERLRPLVEQAEIVVPGHGGPLARSDAIALLEEDLDYLRALLADPADAPLPARRRTSQQRAIHARNVRAARR